MKIILRLLPLSLLAFALNSCVVATAPVPVGVSYSAGVSTGVGVGYADEGEVDVVADPDIEVGYWSPAGVYSAVYLPGYERDYVYYDGSGHRTRYGGYNRHGKSVHHHAHMHGSGHTSSHSGSSHHNTSSSHTSSHSNSHTTTHNTTHTNSTRSTGGHQSFKTAQQKGSAAASQKRGPAPKKKDH